MLGFDVRILTLEVLGPSLPLFKRIAAVLGGDVCQKFVNAEKAPSSGALNLSRTNSSYFAAVFRRAASRDL
jgi:hypothetical protein